MSYHIVLIVLAIVVLAACGKKELDPETAIVKMETSLGDIYIDLYEAETPLHAANFKKLSSEGAYEGIYFHRVMPGFVVQGGDPNTRDNEDRSDDGGGGIGERIPAEIGQEHLRGTLGAARTGVDPRTGIDTNPEKLSSGSQFYFCLSRLSQLDGAYTVFGKVVEGMDVVDEIATHKTDPRDNPIEPVTILKTSLIDLEDVPK
ncbi:MAG: peptidylprolyl isomerase [Candidatus Marinimicrobia bacterium]|nr:peptidylprolyl isomerase [Candidatus Neomarinimicrobiota bacterium]